MIPFSLKQVDGGFSYAKYFCADHQIMACDIWLHKQFYISNEILSIKQHTYDTKLVLSD